MKKVILSLFIFSSSLVTAQNYSIIWQNCIGGSLDDNGYSIQQTTDGGVITVGSAASNDGTFTLNQGDYDVMAVKLDTAGAVVWQKTFGGTGYDQAVSVEQTADGGYIVAGFSASNDGDLTSNYGSVDVWIIKLDTVGTIQWQKSYGGSGDDRPYYIRETADGGYLFSGYTGSNDNDVTFNNGAVDCWVVKLNNTGTIQWQKTYGGTSYDYGMYIVPTPDNGYILTADAYSGDGDVTVNQGDSDCWIVKLDSAGTIQWQKSYGGTGTDYGTSTYPTIDGGYIVAAYTSSMDGDVLANHGGYDAWVMKLNSTGTVQWQKNYGGTADDVDNCFQPAVDGGYILGGYAASYDGDVVGYQGGGADYWIVKIDTAGNLISQKCLGGTGDDEIFYLQQCADSSYVVTGFSDSNDGDVVGAHGPYDCWVLKLDSIPVIIPTAISEQNSGKNITVYPNPSTDVFYFTGLEDGAEIIIQDITGRIVHRSMANDLQEKIDLKNNAKGIYFYSITGKDQKKIQGKICLH